LALNRDNFILIEKAHHRMKDYDGKCNLIYINANFGTLADSFTKLETSELSLYNSIKTIRDIEIKIESDVVISIGREIKIKLKIIL